MVTISLPTQSLDLGWFSRNQTVYEKGREKKKKKGDKRSGHHRARALAPGTLVPLLWHLKKGAMYSYVNLRSCANLPQWAMIKERGFSLQI